MVWLVEALLPVLTAGFRFNHHHHCHVVVTCVKFKLKGTPCDVNMAKIGL